MCNAEGWGKKLKMASMEVVEEVNDSLKKHHTTKLKPFFDGNYNRVVYIVTLATSILFLRAILVFLGPCRRHSRNMFLIAAVWLSNALPFSIVSHTLGLMQSPPYKNEAYAIWAMLCLLIHGISNSTLYEFRDLKQLKKQASEQVMLLYMASWPMYLHHNEGMLGVPLLSILSIAFVKFIFRLIQISFAYFPSYRLFSSSRKTKLVADFMNLEHQLSDHVDPISMKGYKYIVRGEENMAERIANKEHHQQNQEEINNKVVTVERIWQCKGKLLCGSPQGEQLKDKCLSFALFRLLVMRCKGYTLHKEHLSKNWNLVRGVLLSEENKHERDALQVSSKKSEYERTFEVIEDELSFLYDCCYTRYPLFFSHGKFFVTRTIIFALLELAQFVAGLWIVIALTISGQFSNKDFNVRDYEFCKNRIWADLLDYDCSHLPASIHFYGTCIFVAAYVVLRILQLLVVVFSNWAKVWLICEYVERRSWQGNEILESLIGFVCNWELIPLKPWKRQMGQFFLLSSYRYHPIPHFLISALFCIPKRGVESQDCKKLDPLVKRAVLDALMENGPELTNGLSSLQRNGLSSSLSGVSWACRFKSITESILVWHVATSFCAMEEEYRQGKESPSQVKEKREVAECLSGYCAYLVAALPALLPDPTDAVELVFDKAILDARNSLGRCSDCRGVYDELKKFSEGPVCPELNDSAENKGDAGVVVMGTELGKQLVAAETYEGQRWKVLVEFWAEMILFLAPSNNAMGHVKSMENGGEFITHLWALLTHVGGSRKDSDPRLEHD